MKKRFNFFEKEIFKEEPKIRTFIIKNLKKYLKEKTKFKLKFNPRIKKLKNYHGFKVYSVNGELIRDKIDIDFIMGGNGSRYVYIPLNEIWVEKPYSKGKELNYVLLHEYIELNLMKHGMNYSEAHDLASAKELMMRRKS